MKLPGEQGSVVDLVREEDVRVRALCVDQEVGDLTRLVGPLVGDDLEVVEAVEAPVEVAAADPDQSEALHDAPPRVGRFEGDLELAALLVPEP